LELLAAMRARLFRVAEFASEKGVRLMVDAEHSYFQPAIDNATLELMRIFNSRSCADRPVIFNTYQCYLKDAHTRLENDMLKADREDWIFAAKIVRGAYMVLERGRATEMGYPSPIHDTKANSDDCYNGAVAKLLDARAAGKGTEVLVASHNQESIELAAQGCTSRGLPKEDGLYFGQLLGMADHLTYGLAAHGYNAFKYTPFGPIDEVIPYLLRRAQENSDLMGGVGAEIKMLRGEIINRTIPFMRS